MRHDQSEMEKESRETETDGGCEHQELNKGIQRESKRGQRGQKAKKRRR